MVKIRLMRVGKRHRPYFRIVVADSRRARNGRVLDVIGHFDPLHKDVHHIDFEAYDAWILKGAQPTPRVASLVKKLKKEEKEVASQQEA